MRDTITSAVRTGVQAIVTGGVAWLATTFAIELPADAVAGLEIGLFALAMAVVTLVLNLVARKFPWLNQVMSLGRGNESVSYDKAA